MKKNKETIKNIPPVNQQLLHENDRRFDELRKAIQLNDENCIVSISQELIDDYYMEDGFDELSKILLDFVLEGKSKLVLKLKYGDYRPRPMIQELFVDYALKKMSNYVDYYAERKDLNEEEKKEFNDSIIDAVVESGYSIINSFLLDRDNVVISFEIDAKIFFEQYTDMIFDIAYMTLNFKSDYKPNIKYSDEMYKYTDSLLFAGKKKYVAYRETLIKFGFTELNEDSYRKRYSDYIKNRK